MAFPFALALMGLSAAGSIGASLGTPSGVQGQGRMNRLYAQQSQQMAQAQQAQMSTAATAMRYFDAAGDVTNPLFRRTAAIEESRLRRSIAEGLATGQLMQRQARARGLTAGVRPERQDEAMYRSLADAYGKASEAAGGIAQQRLSETGRGLLGVANSYGGTAASAGAQAGNIAQWMSNAETASNVAQSQKYQQIFDTLGMIGAAAGGGKQLAGLFGGGGAASPASAGITNSYYAPSGWPAAWQQGLNGAGGPQFSWRGGP